MKLRQVLWSTAGFVALVAVLVAVDERVRDKFERFLWGGDGIAFWDDKALGLWRTATVAINYGGMENGPLLVFAVVGAVLFVFMVRA
jgi:hypothetical protein